MRCSQTDAHAVSRAFVKGSVLTAPFIIGFILGPMAETNFRRGLQLSEGNFMGFLTTPISGVFLGLAALSITWQIWSGLRARPDPLLTEALDPETEAGFPDKRSGEARPS